ncbi:hypothetical protein A2164_03490 [Candidatus Curtissbacteria bacterium RBG_13_35_7]|uniref:Uncharacterized protein n=1 Tax=Candidatus Curtissbacteria bacterium RBG_13_35_7 TaxID=1797705 RepID=A0A1F5G3Y3_9BACT|nr:MAG: hypothetical protein A2164_03490 [Candidatus Curtissbacteria bacterium RBG_13_35_7]
MYFLLKNGHINLKDLLDLSRKKFGSVFAPKLFLEQLTYFGNVKDFTIEYIAKEYEPNEIQQYFKKLIKNYIKF